MTTEGVKERLHAVRERIRDACRASGRDPGAVRLVAVSKRQPPERVEAAVEAGHLDFGENFVKALVEKKARWPTCRWHLIGHLQSNKARLVPGVAELVHTLDSVKLARALAKAGPTQALIQVRQGDEATKSGVLSADTRGLLDALADVAEIEVRGLMSIPPPGEGARYFAELRELRDELQRETGLALPELSMGMSGDFEAAVREGATIVRVGTAIFGPRDADP